MWHSECFVLRPTNARTLQSLHDNDCNYNRPNLTIDYVDIPFRITRQEAELTRPSGLGWGTCARTNCDGKPTNTTHTNHYSVLGDSQELSVEYEQPDRIQKSYRISDPKRGYSSQFPQPSMACRVAATKIANGSDWLHGIIDSGLHPRLHKCCYPNLFSPIHEI